MERVVRSQMHLNRGLSVSSATRTIVTGGTIGLLSVAALLPGLAVTSPADGRGDERRRLTGPAADEEIEALIRSLSDLAYENRTFATRRLCAIGMPAAGALRKVAEGNDAESALRARTVLTVLDQIMFAGVEVRLAVSKGRIAWDEAVDLNVTMINRSKYMTRVPFELDAEKRRLMTDNARQVGDMLDLAELLTVRDAAGRKVELTVDDIAADQTVTAAVQQRLNGGPSSVLGAGGEVVLNARAFNRGWARYPLLDGGAYTLLLEYVPEWADDVLAAERVGRVVSQEAAVTVATAAPPSISRTGAEASLVIERDGRFLVVWLINQADQPAVVNKNFGPAAPFAEGRWVWRLDGDSRDLPVVPKLNASWHDFDAALLAEVAPGERLELARTDIDELRKGLAQSGAEVGASRWTVQFVYANLCNRAWQERQGSALLGNEKAPVIFRTPLPRRILSAQYTSNQLAAPAAGGR